MQSSLSLLCLGREQSWGQAPAPREEVAEEIGWPDAELFSELATGSDWLVTRLGRMLFNRASRPRHLARTIRG